ncbi:hypothetical protein P9112_003263 [Eukaryota sp. TZLM1-RC]
MDPSSFSLPGTKEITHLASLAVSSAKALFPPSHLTDGDVETLWQSDGILPHFINITFIRRLCISHLAIFLDPQQDASYSPSQIAIRVGEHPAELRQLLVVSELEHHSGWSSIPLFEDDDSPGVQGSLIQLVMMSNLDSGRDSALRQIKIFTRDLSYRKSRHDLKWRL